MTDHVILVDTNDREIGTMAKMEAHIEGLLHRAFSVFIFNTKGELLLQRRAFEKYHSGGKWTNTCCSHPRPGEALMDAAQRRLQEEMGFTTGLIKAFDFIYKAPYDNGLTEYEFDHVLVGTYTGKIVPNKDEVADFCFKSMEEIKDSLQSHASKYTAWFKIAFPKLETYLLAEKEH